MKNMKKTTAIIAMTMLASANAEAATFRFKELTQHPQVKNIITLGFALIAILEVINYAQNFELSDAVKKALRPALAIFMYFKWQNVFEWIGLA